LVIVTKFASALETKLILPVALDCPILKFPPVPGVPHIFISLTPVPK
jgi:hypothetical protein